jgi:hypothetical protein
MPVVQPLLILCFITSCFSGVILGLLSFVVDDDTSGINLKDKQKPLAANACLIAAGGYFLLGIFCFIKGEIALLYRSYSSCTFFFFQLHCTTFLFTAYTPLRNSSYEEAYRLVEMKPLLPPNQKSLTVDSIGTGVDSAKNFWKEESFYDRETF